MVLPFDLLNIYLFDPPTRSLNRIKLDHLTLQRLFVNPIPFYQS